MNDSQVDKLLAPCLNGSNSSLLLGSSAGAFCLRNPLRTSFSPKFRFFLIFDTHLIFLKYVKRMAHNYSESIPVSLSSNPT